MVTGVRRQRPAGRRPPAGSSSSRRCPTTPPWSTSTPITRGAAITRDSRIGGLARRRPGRSRRPCAPRCARAGSPLADVRRYADDPADLRGHRRHLEPRAWVPRSARPWCSWRCSSCWCSPSSAGATRARDLAVLRLNGAGPAYDPTARRSGPSCRRSCSAVAAGVARRARSAPRWRCRTCAFLPDGPGGAGHRHQRRRGPRSLAVAAACLVAAAGGRCADRASRSPAAPTSSA